MNMSMNTRMATTTRTGTSTRTTTKTQSTSRTGWPLNIDYFSADSVQPIPAARCFYPPVWIFFHIVSFLHKTILSLLDNISDYLI